MQPGAGVGLLAPPRVEMAEMVTTRDVEKVLRSAVACLRDVALLSELMPETPGE